MPHRATAPATATKTLVVLANAQRNHDRCIAGRELIPLSRGRYRVGGWVRPVSASGEGELHHSERQLETGGEPQLLDRVEVPLLESAPLPEQPDNWLVAAGQPWQRAGRLDPRLLSHFEETPADLWLQPSAGQDWVDCDWLAAHPPAQSLYLIRPERRVEDKLDPALLDGGCLLCSEATPEHCHRRLVAEYLARHWPEVRIQHL